MLKDFISRLHVLDYGQRAAHHYGEIKSGLERQGVVIGPNDQHIAGQANETLETWYQFFLETGINIDHLEDDDIPDGMEEEQYIAEDAWELVNKVGLILPNGQLSLAAQSLTPQSETPVISRTDEDYLAVRDLLAWQIREQYRGANELSIIQLLQDCADALENSHSAWVALCPGLLLIEVQYLIEIAHVDFNLAQSQPNLIVARRDRIMQAIEMPDPTIGNAFLETLHHSDAVTNAYLTELERIGQKGMTLTEL